MTDQAVRRTILARVIRDIPTLGGDVKRGTLVNVAGGEIEVIDGSRTRFVSMSNLACRTTGEIRVSCARRWQEFEIVEAEQVEPARSVIDSINDI